MTTLFKKYLALYSRYIVIACIFLYPTFSNAIYNGKTDDSTTALPYADINSSSGSCTGVFISANTILTSAHCFQGHYTKLYKQTKKSQRGYSRIIYKYAYYNDRQSTPTFNEVYVVVTGLCRKGDPSSRLIEPLPIKSKIRFLPSFTKESASLRHDVAIIQLQRPIKKICSNDLIPISLTNDSVKVGSTVKLIGWGETASSTPSVLPSRTSASSKVVKCPAGVELYTLCVNGTSIPCSGDSGTLILNDKNEGIGVFSSLVRTDEKPMVCKPFPTGVQFAVAIPIQDNIIASNYDWLEYMLKILPTN